MQIRVALELADDHILGRETMLMCFFFALEDWMLFSKQWTGMASSKSDRDGTNKHITGNDHLFSDPTLRNPRAIGYSYTYRIYVF